MTENIIREAQIVTGQAVNQYRGKFTWTDPGVTISRIGVRKDGVTYGTYHSMKGQTYAVILNEGNRWTVVG